jgi:hypothetical protein
MTPTVRILKAFSWMRWRVLMNSLERSGSRDLLERFSLAIEQLGPIMAAILLIPAAALLAGAGGYSGWSLAQGSTRPMAFEVIRFLLFATCGLTVVGPLFLPAADRTHAVRLLLLPISRPILYFAQTVTAINDPWILLIVPVIATVPLGLAVGGAPGTAMLAALGGLLLLVILLGISSIVTSLIQLMVRNRRRGELLTLLFILFIPVVGMLPALLEDNSPPARTENAEAEEPGTPAWLTALEKRVLPVVPSEMYVRATRASVLGRTSDAAAPLLGLAVAAGLIHATAFVVFRRFLDSPGTTGSQQRGSKGRSRTWRLPGTSPATSAVTIAHILLTLRTPRGRSTVLSPLMVFAVFAAMMWRGSTADFDIVPLESGVGLAIFGSFISLLTVLPLAMNQFAIDGPGLTLEFLSPLDDSNLLRGKALGNAFIGAIPMLVCIAVAAVLFPGGSLSAWLSIPIGISASYVLLAPVAAALSAVFPRTVDLNSIGRGSNAHGAATLLGLLASIASGAASLGINLAIVRSIATPPLALTLMLMWLAGCIVVARLLFVPVRALLARRRENLVLIR